MESRDLLAYLGGLGAGVREITKGENSANYMMEGGFMSSCHLWNKQSRAWLISDGFLVGTEPTT